MTITQKQQAEMLEAARPLIKWMNENTPHPTVRPSSSLTGSSFEATAMMTTDEFIDSVKAVGPLTEYEQLMAKIKSLAKPVNQGVKPMRDNIKFSDVNTGACQPNGKPWPETVCEGCKHAEEGSPDSERPKCNWCTHNDANASLEFDDCLYDNFEQRGVEVEPIEPQDDYYNEDKQNER